MTVVCWDIDGTLLTTGRAGILAFEQAVAEVTGRTVDFAHLPTAGETDAGVAALALEHAGVEPEPAAVGAVLERYERHLPHRLPLREGRVLANVREILDHLRKGDSYSILLTGNTRAGAAAKLAHYGLDGYFTEGAFCEAPGPRESIASRAREIAARLLGREPEGAELYVIGDTPHDVRCGKSIGARTIAVASGGYELDVLRATDPWLALEQLPRPAEFGHLVEAGA